MLRLGKTPLDDFLSLKRWPTIHMLLGMPKNLTEPLVVFWKPSVQALCQWEQWKVCSCLSSFTKDLASRRRGPAVSWIFNLRMIFRLILELKYRHISHCPSKRNEVSFDCAKCRWILQSKSALSGWCRTVSSLWHNIIWNDIEQHAFGTKLLAGFSFDSSKFIALIPRSFNPLWHKLRLAFVKKTPLYSLFLYLKLLLTIYASTSDTHFEWQKEKKNRIEGRKGQVRLNRRCLCWGPCHCSVRRTRTLSHNGECLPRIPWGWGAGRRGGGHEGRGQGTKPPNWKQLQWKAFPFMGSCLPPPPPPPTFLEIKDDFLSRKWFWNTGLVRMTCRQRLPKFHIILVMPGSRWAVASARRGGAAARPAPSVSLRGRHLCPGPGRLCWGAFGEGISAPREAMGSTLSLCPSLDQVCISLNTVTCSVF